MKMQTSSKKRKFWFILAHFKSKQLIHKHAKNLIVLLLNYVDT